MAKERDLLLLEECFSDIMQKIDVDENISKIESTLKRFFDISFKIGVVENTTNEFFGMNIFPSIGTMDKVVAHILSKKNGEDVVRIWQESECWYLEIDSILLCDNSLNANPAEIVAVLLHEIGTIIYSNTIPIRLMKLLRMKLMKLDYQLRSLITNEKIRKLLSLAVIESCTSKNFNFMSSEKDVDKFVARYCYGENLDSFITKLISSYGNSLIDRPEHEIDNEAIIIVNWTITNVKELEFRKKVLRESLKVEMLKTPSLLIKQVIQKIYKAFFGDTTDQYRMLLSEQYTDNPTDTYAELQAEQYLMAEYNKILKESLNAPFDKNGKLKKISQLDLDLITVDIEKIETNDDKIYVLDKIYNKIELVDIALSYIENSDTSKKVQQSKSTLNNMMAQLHTMRERTLGVKVIDKDYGVFIRYPKGYEG